jgi:hypothetical protein
MNENLEDKISLEAEDISADKLTIGRVILLHLNRLNTLFSTGFASAPKGMYTSCCANGIISGLATLEAMLANTLTPSYFQGVAGLKKQIYQSQSESIQTCLADSNPAFSLRLSSQWYALLVKELGMAGLIPTKKGELTI